MAAEYTEITLAEMNEELTRHGFQRMLEFEHRGQEICYGKRIQSQPPISLRIYTSIASGDDRVRPNGKDAIRVVAVTRVPVEGTYKVEPIGKNKRVHRVKNWRKNLAERIQTVEGELAKGESCPKCGAVMIKRKGAYGEFLGCVNFPHTGCRGSRQLAY